MIGGGKGEREEGKQGGMCGDGEKEGTDTVDRSVLDGRKAKVEHPSGI